MNFKIIAIEQSDGFYCLQWTQGVNSAIFSRSFKVAIATSNFMNEVYNGGFAPEFNVSMLKETIVLVGDYVSETRK